MNANQPAFPRTAADPQWGKGTESFDGLTKRELMAAMAMQGLLAYHGRQDAMHYYSEWAVKYADALLTELDKTKGE